MRQFGPEEVKTLNRRLHPCQQGDWETPEDDEPSCPSPRSWVQEWCEMSWVKGPLSTFSSELGFPLTSLLCRNFWISPPRNLDRLVFCIPGSLFLSRDPVLQGLLRGTNVPTYIFPEVPVCSLPRSPNIAWFPHGASLHLSFRAECDAALHFAGFVHSKTNKQRPKHTPAGLLSEN